ncbi:MAG: nitrile hydratase accessory protein [Chloroflexota bacterium]|nr:nitrile hydratase accessory protein [Chloroflexota bacterium]
MDRIPYLKGSAAVPRQKGKPVFQAPWEARAFALVIKLYEHGEYVWDEFRDRLIAEIAAAEAAHPDHDSGTHYYECWLASFERLLTEKNILMPDEIETRMDVLEMGQASSKP